MRHAVRLFVIAVVVVLSHTAAAQKYLELKSKKDRQDKYAVILRKVFARIHQGDVVVAVLCKQSFKNEWAAGILKTPRGYEAFSVTLSDSVWSTEYHQFVGIQRDEIQRLREERIAEGLPLTYRDIKTRLQAQARPVPADLAERVKQLWEAKLLQALNPPPGPKESEQYIALDGVTYQYSMPLKGYGHVTADGKLILEDTPVWLMGELAEALAAYAQGRVSEDVLKKALERVEPKRA